MNTLIAVFDTETTGLTLHPDAPLDKQPKIIEVGVALMDAYTEEVVDTLNLFVDPQEPITAEITKITGITDADLKGAPTFPQAEPQLRAFFGRAKLVVAHNLPFDRAMMFNELARAGVQDFPWPAIEICTVGLYAPEWGRNPRLIELYEWACGEPLAQTHRALDDVMALVRVLKSARTCEAIR